MGGGESHSNKNAKGRKSSNRFRSLELEELRVKAPSIHRPTMLRHAMRGPLAATRCSCWFYHLQVPGGTLRARPKVWLARGNNATAHNMFKESEARTFLDQVRAVKFTVLLWQRNSRLKVLGPELLSSKQGLIAFLRCEGLSSPLLCKMWQDAFAWEQVKQAARI